MLLQDVVVFHCRTPPPPPPSSTQDPSSEISPSPWSFLDWLSDPRNAVSEDALAHALPAAAHRVPHIPPLIDHDQIRVCSGQEICPHATVAQGLRCRTSYCLRPSTVMNLDLGPSTPIPVYPMGGRVTPLVS